MLQYVEIGKNSFEDNLQKSKKVNKKIICNCIRTHALQITIRHIKLPFFKFYNISKTFLKKYLNDVQIDLTNYLK